MRKLTVALLFAAVSVGGGIAHADESFTLQVAPVVAHKGQPATAHVVIKPGSGFHMNHDYPLSLKMAPHDGVQFAKPSLSKADAQLSDEQASFELVVTAAAAGKATLTGELRFAVCSASSCDPKKAPVAVNVEVK